MKLHLFHPSPNSWKVRAVAAHCGIEAEEIFVDITMGDQHADAFVAVNPCRRTPALEDGDFRLWESTAIMQYLAQSAGSPLWPGDAKARAHVMQWMSWHLQHWGPATEKFVFETIVKPLVGQGDPDPVAIAAATPRLHAEAATLDAHLKGRDALVGDGLTLADFAVVSTLTMAQPARMPLDGFAEIHRWSANILALPAWTSTAPN